MLDERGGEISADLLRFYGVDIHGLFTGEYSPRFIVALVENLPIESSTYSTRIAEGDRGNVGWDRNTYVMADLVDAINILHTSLVRVNTSNPKKVKDPEPYERPGMKERKRKANTSNPFANALSSDESVEFSPGGETKSFSISSDVLKRSQKQAANDTEGQPFTVN
ncbi:hypothetical protein ACFC1L_40085 [Streptomyces sp. NPDC056210]|uniref:hypothetical protein n=1 Tax=Streptomyces sp. NPDC056210 TaxID=3345746 RepID=UPI0035DA3E3A